MPRLGLLLPLTGPDRRIGEELRDGVQLANREAGSPFELVIEDTGIDYGHLPIATERGGDVSESPASGFVTRGVRCPAAAGSRRRGHRRPAQEQI